MKAGGYYVPLDPEYPLARLRFIVSDTGMDVILAHRLLKNGVTTSRAYVLLTDALLGWLGLDPIELGLVARVESYEHLGDIRCFVRALDAPPAGEVLTAGAQADALEATAAA